MPRTFKKLLPVQEPQPGGAPPSFRLWADPSLICTIEHAELSSVADFKSLTFFIGDQTLPLLEGKLVKLLLAHLLVQQGQHMPVPTGKFLWINPGHIFAIGSFLSTFATNSQTVIWPRPPSGTVVLDPTNAYQVMMPNDASSSPYHAAADSRPKAVAKLLGIELEDAS
jgi:hypothetical protein